jgi:predicted DNA-binding transcriptional regulator AlpA
MSEAQLLERIDKMTSAMQFMATMLGTRLDRAQLAERMGVHRNTLAKRLASNRDFPRPGRDGKWLLSEVIEWEQRQS